MPPVPVLLSSLSDALVSIQLLKIHSKIMVGPLRIIKSLSLTVLTSFNQSFSGVLGGASPDLVLPVSDVAFSRVYVCVCACGVCSGYLFNSALHTSRRM